MSLLEQGQQHAGELAGKVTANTDSASAEGSLTVRGASWWMRVIGSLTGRRGAKPDATVTVEGAKRWLVGRQGD